MVRRKIFDITPPQLRELGEEPLKTATKEPLKHSLAPSKAGRAKRNVFSTKKIVPIFTGACLLLGLILSYFLIPPKTSIEIWPQKGNIEETATVTVSPASVTENSFTGEVLEVEKVFSQDFPAQEVTSKEVKARGIVRVYNNYSAASQPLLATTRFLSNDGKLFRTPQKVMVPGGYYEGGKLVPGFIDIEVVADQPGEEYNISPSTFSIPGLAGTPKYTFFYAKSSEPMAGGIKKDVLVAGQKELDKAREVLSQKALDEASAVIKGQLSSGDYVIIDKAVSGKVTDFQSSVTAGQETESFSGQVKFLTKAIVFKNSALNSFVINYIKRNTASGEKLIESSLKVEYSAQTVDFNKNELTLKLVISAQSHSLPEEIEIKDMIKRKNTEEIEGILKDLVSVQNAKVEFWPFWVNSAPESIESIDVVLHLD